MNKQISIRKLLLITLCVLTCATTYAQNITTIAGSLGDGEPAINMPLFEPQGVAVDKLGNIYIVDVYSYRIRKVTASTGIISTVAGNGTIGFGGDNGAATSAKLFNPTGVAVDDSGNIYIADRDNHRIRKVSASTGIISTVAGNGILGYGGDGNAATLAKLNYPSGVAVDGLGNIYISDDYNYRIRKVSASTGIISTVAGTGSPGFNSDGTIATSSKLNPSGVAVDNSGNIYIADDNRIRKVTASTGIISTVAGNGNTGFTGDGSVATSANLSGACAVAVDGSGNVYLADYYNHRIRKVTASNGIINTIAGNGTQGYGGDSSAATLANLNFPTGVAVDNSGNIYIADKDNHRIRKITATSGIISTVAGNGTPGFNGDGRTANSATLLNPKGLAVDSLGNIYIADQYNHRIRKITKSTGIISTVAGNGTAAYGGDGSAATTASLYNPTGVAIDGSGNIYIADQFNHRIRKVTASNGIISTVAGNGIQGYAGDGSAAILAKLNSPVGVAVDGSGNIYIADRDNKRIRKVTASTGIISTVAGNGTQGFGGDGSAATLANLNYPSGVTVDSLRNIYIADTYNKRIRKVTISTGVISTIAGNGTSGFNGDGWIATSATLLNPIGVTVDGLGNIYISDEASYRIRKVAVSTSIISTIAGNGIQGYGGDSIAATSANLNYPIGTAVDESSGNIYIADAGSNGRIRKVRITIANNVISSSQTICVGSAPAILTGSTPISDTASYTYTWLRSTTSATAGFTAIPSTNTKNYSPSALSQNTWFRRYVVSGAFTDTSLAIAITVNNAIGNDSITSSAHTICSGSIPATIAATIATGGNGTTYKYKWLKSTTSATNGFTNAGGNDSTQNFTSGALTQNTWFKRRVTSGVCNADTTAALLVTINNAITNNTITGVAQTICSGSIPDTIIASIAIGGNGTTYTYRWLKSITSATTGFANAGGNDSTQNFTSGTLTQNTWFKRRVSSGVCSADTTTALMVTVNNAITNNTITGVAQTICAGSIPNTIIASIAAGGNGTTYKYKWLKSTTSATTGFTNAGGNDSSQNFTSNALTQNTWFKRIAISGVCNADTTAALLVMINDAIATNIITDGAQTICSGSIPGPITGSTASGGNGTTYAYRWLKSITNASTGFAKAGDNDSVQNFNPSVLTQNTWFKRIVTSGVCNADTTAALLVTVNSAIASNTITSTAQTICSGSVPAPITATTSTGGNGTTYTYKWIKSVTSATTGFANAGGNDTTQNLTPNSITQNTWFKRIVSSGICGADTTSASIITINNTITNNTFTGDSQTICSGSIPAQLTATTATGGNGATYNYKWLKSITSATTGFANAGGNDTTQNFISNALTQNTWFKRKVTSGVCSEDTTTALLVKVNPKPTITNASTANICSGTSTNIILAANVASTFAWTLGTNTGSITGASASNGSSISQLLTNPSNTIEGSVVYNVTPTSILGSCVGNSTAITVTINPIPSTSNITGLTNVARLDTASYSVNGLSGSVFNWVTAKGLVQTGAGTNQIQVKWNIAGMDTLKVIETSNQGCVGSQKTLLVNIGPATGMNEINTSNNILVYPNPFNETIFISLLNNSGLNKAILYDLLGKEVLTTHKNEIDVKELKSGVYLIMVIDNNDNNYSQKLIKN